MYYIALDVTNNVGTRRHTRYNIILIYVYINIDGYAVQRVIMQKTCSMEETMKFVRIISTRFSHEPTVLDCEWLYKIMYYTTTTTKQRLVNKILHYYNIIICKNSYDIRDLSKKYKLKKTNILFGTSCIQVRLLVNNPLIHYSHDILSISFQHVRFPVPYTIDSLQNSWKMTAGYYNIVYATRKTCECVQLRTS